MKQPALTGLIFLTAIRSVSACSLASYPDKPNFDPMSVILRQTETYFYILVALVFANVALFFLRRKNDYVSLAIVIGVAIAMIPVTIFVGGMDSCFIYLRSVLEWEISVFLVVSMLHVGLWFFGERLNWPFRQFK